MCVERRADVVDPRRGEMAHGLVSEQTQGEDLVVVALARRVVAGMDAAPLRDRRSCPSGIRGGASPERP
jgi:hypothetical protein